MPLIPAIVKVEDADTARRPDCDNEVRVTLLTQGNSSVLAEFRVSRRELAEACALYGHPDTRGGTTGSVKLTCRYDPDRVADPELRNVRGRLIEI